MTKQTVANNDFLRNVKKAWNKNIFKKASLLVNSDGEDVARAYVQQFTRKTLTY